MAERRALAGVFAVYLVLLVWLVMWKLHLPFIGRDDMRELKLTPFAEDDGYGASSPVEVLGNLVVFLPLGVFLRFLAPGWGWWRVAAAAAALSLAFEIGQYVTAAGSSDVTDVITNTAGAVAGFALSRRPAASPARGARRRSGVPG
jgi:glycopeptide antibiotics resistance protein